MTWLDRLFKGVDHNRWTVLGVLLCLGIAVALFGTVGCESTTLSLTGSGDKVARTELAKEAETISAGLAGDAAALEAALVAHNAKVTAHNESVALSVADLDRKDEIRLEILETVGAIATQAASGTFNPVSLIPTLVGLGGLVLAGTTAADNRRKDKVIANVGDTS